MVRRVVLGCVFIFLLSAALIGFRARTFLVASPSSEHQERIIQIANGSSVRSISSQLEAESVVTDARLFGYYVRLRGGTHRLKAGEFRFFTDQTPAQVLQVLEQGEEVTYRLTFPEGFNILEMAHVVSQTPFLNGEKFLAIARDPATAKALNVPAPTLEGFLFPSTYEITRSDDEQALIKKMVGTFNARWSPVYNARARALQMDQLQVVTLASIIEKETGDLDEMSLVSGVFHNRLNKRMKLESDPTIIYGLPNYQGNIRRSDIHHPHPWNTYVIYGLPPSPITNPGALAIRAALFPAQTNHLYFVATGDGRHSFSETYPEHAQKVIEYQIRRRAIPQAKTP